MYYQINEADLQALQAQHEELIVLCDRYLSVLRIEDESDALADAAYSYSETINGDKFVAILDTARLARKKLEPMVREKFNALERRMDILAATAEKLVIPLPD